MTKSQLIALTIVVLAAILALTWLWPTNNPERNRYHRRAILVNCAADLYATWRNLGELNQNDVERVLEASDEKCDRFEIAWHPKISEERCSFAQVIVRGGSTVERVFLVDLVDKEGGYCVGPSGYTWLAQDGLSNELRESDIGLCVEFVAR